MAKNRMYYFMYSQSQVSEEKSINAKISRDFLCGEVSVGPKVKKISDIIPDIDLAGYAQRFPDYEIVHKGIKNKTTYKNPTTPFIGSGKE